MSRSRPPARPAANRKKPTYFTTTRHPWPCLVFLLPLLGAYELGLLCVGGAQAPALRTGADTWLHWGLRAFGLPEIYWVPGAVVLLLLAWSWLRRKDRPQDLVGVCTGMAIESVVFAIGLWGLGRGLTPFLQSFGIRLAVPAAGDETIVQLLTFVGAGIYEEVLFRLLLFAGLLALLRQFGLPGGQAFLFSALASALAFSAAHHAGPYGERFDAYAFLFRTLAGLYFTVLFRFRGFGIAVGAHACYDLLVGLKLG